MYVYSAAWGIIFAVCYVRQVFQFSLVTRRRSPLVSLWCPTCGCGEWVFSLPISTHSQAVNDLEAPLGAREGRQTFVGVLLGSSSCLWTPLVCVGRSSFLFNLRIAAAFRDLPEAAMRPHLVGDGMVNFSLRNWGLV